MYQEREL